MRLWWCGSGKLALVAGLAVGIGSALHAQDAAPLREMEGTILDRQARSILFESTDASGRARREVVVLPSMDPQGMPAEGERVRLSLRGRVVQSIVVLPPPARPLRTVGRISVAGTEGVCLVEATLLEKISPAPGRPQAVPDALAVYRWRVDAVSFGQLPTNEVLVAHWVRHAGVAQPEADWMPGERRTLQLEALARHPAVRLDAIHADLPAAPLRWLDASVPREPTPVAADGTP